MMGEDVPLPFLFLFLFLFLFILGVIGAAGVVARRSDGARLGHQSPRRPGLGRLSGPVGVKTPVSGGTRPTSAKQRNPAVFAVALAVGLFVAVRVAMWGLGF